MFNKNEASAIKSRFWTRFGKFMSYVPSSWNPNVNWINYKTGIKNLYFRMDANNKIAKVSIEITHDDAGLRSLFYEQLQEFKLLLEECMQEKWEWSEEYYNEQGIAIATVFTTLENKNLYLEENWPDLFSFFKKRVTAFDDFWCDAQHIFKDLAT